MNRRGINDETLSIAVSCVDLDVKMARENGWTEDDIITTWETISAAVRTTDQMVAKRRGHTRQCSICECWTVPKGPCHLCERDQQRTVPRPK